MDMNAYKRRLGASNSSEALVNTTIEQVKSMFFNSPLYKKVLINGIEKDARVSINDNGGSKILLMPEEEVNKGDIVNVDDEKWLVTKSIKNKIYPKGSMKLCNAELKWIDENNVSMSYPSVIKSNSYEVSEGKYVNIPKGEAIAIVTYDNNTKNIKPFTRFIINENTFEVSGVDNITDVNNNSGLLVIRLEIASKSSTDDETEGIADNSTNNTWGGGW